MKLIVPPNPLLATGMFKTLKKTVYPKKKHKDLCFLRISKKLLIMNGQINNSDSMRYKELENISGIVNMPNAKNIGRD